MRMESPECTASAYFASSGQAATFDGAMEIICQRSTPDDDAFLQELFFAVRAPEFQLAGLAGPMLTQLLEMQYRAQYTSYVANYPAAKNSIVWVDGERAGRMLVDQGDACHLIDIALLPQYRGRGIGTQVLQQMCVEARGAGKTVRLSVRPENPARRLYERLGFRATASDMTQIVMELALAEGTPPAQPVEVVTTSPPQDYSFEYFQALMGQALQARLIRDDSGSVPAAVEAIVAGVERLSVPSAKMRAGDSFRIELFVAGQPPFHSECIELTPVGARPMAVFVSALGPRDGGMTFEAIFNRSERLYPLRGAQ